jgi:catechol 2,3-dioxygenase-like lactoylglutathione lyase family enzyme
MKDIVNRPVTLFAPGAGLFRNDHFQIAYNTTDMDRAVALFAKRFGVKEFRRLEGGMPAGGRIRMEIGWAGGVMIELVWAEGPGSEIFRAALPEEGFATRLHHLGYHVPTAEGWDAVQKEVKREGLKVVHTTDIPGFLKAIIVEDSELGHFLEYIYPDAGGIAFFEGAPNN